MYQYHLYRTINNSINFSLLAVIIHPESLYCDTTAIEAGNLYSYSLAAVDSAGNQSDFSDTVSAGIPKIEWVIPTISNSETTNVDLSQIISDPDHPFSQLEVNISDVNHIGFYRRNQSLFLYATPHGYFGPAGLSLTVTDPDGFWDSTSVYIEVENNLFLDLPSTKKFVPHTTILYSNYPNPFNSSTQIYFALAHSGPLLLTLYNALGERVKTICEGWHEAGLYRTEFDGANFASGIYYATMQTDEYEKTIKLILLK